MWRGDAMRAGLFGELLVQQGEAAHRRRVVEGVDPVGRAVVRLARAVAGLRAASEATTTEVVSLTRTVTLLRWGWT